VILAVGNLESSQDPILTNSGASARGILKSPTKLATDKAQPAGRPPRAAPRLEFSGGGITNPATNHQREHKEQPETERISTAGNAAAATLPATLATRMQETGFVSTKGLLLVAL
jgi:hypothetical protein